MVLLHPFFVQRAPPRKKHTLTLSVAKADSITLSPLRILSDRRERPLAKFWISPAPLISLQELRRLVNWLCEAETHQFNNCVAVTLLCDTDHQGVLLDRVGVPTFTLSDLIQRLSAVVTLTGKPKLILVQSCRNGELVIRFRGR